jgi:hypothetical protein
MVFFNPFTLVFLSSDLRRAVAFSVALKTRPVFEKLMDGTQTVCLLFPRRTPALGGVAMGGNQKPLNFSKSSKDFSVEHAAKSMSGFQSRQLETGNRRVRNPAYFLQSFLTPPAPSHGPARRIPFYRPGRRGKYFLRVW